MFRKARQTAPCILFFDEIDALLPVRSGALAESQVSERVLTQFLTELDGIEDTQGSPGTRRHQPPGSAGPGGDLGRALRCDHRGALARCDRAAGDPEILGIHLARRPVAQELRVEDLVGPSDGLSAAEIATDCNRATLMAVRRCMAESSNTPCIRATDLRAALDSVRAER